MGIWHIIRFVRRSAWTGGVLVIGSAAALILPGLNWAGGPSTANNNPRLGTRGEPDGQELSPRQERETSDDQDPPQDRDRDQSELPSWSTNPDAEPWPDQTFTTTELPEAPEEVARLLQEGNVEFVFYDAQAIRRRMTGETRFTLRYRTNHQLRWQLQRQANGQGKLTIRPILRPVQWELEHKVLLPSYMIGPDFYQEDLVRHELDHVRITLDSRYRQLFQQWLREDLRTVRLELPPGFDVSQFSVLAHQAIEQETAERFTKLLDLIQIRHQELDRETQHGRRPLPDDFLQRPIESVTPPPQ